MDIRDEHNLFPRESEGPAHALGIITAIVLVAGFAMVAAWFALLLLDDRRSEPQARAALDACRICGVVEEVRELAPAPLQMLEGSRAEGAVILLAALGGVPAGGVPQARIFETSVVHDDGTVRVLRDAFTPNWKPGDRVRVIKGRVEPGALPAERKSIPDPQAARAR